MSSVSPAAILFDINGVTLSVYNNTAIPASTPALLFAGSDGTNSQYQRMSTYGASYATVASTNEVVQSNATVTASGSLVVTTGYFGTQEIALVVNVGTVTGAGSIQYSIQEIDPGDGVTLYGNTASTVSISSGNAPGVFTAVLNITTSSAVKVTWTVTGTFSATIYSTLVSKSSPSTQTINGTVTATNNSVGSDGAAALAFDTQVGGKTTTAAPTYTTGNLDALSLTTLGGLRIDGVYATGTANATAADAIVSGGYVTTAAPTYTTGQLNALSLDTSGNLRVTGFVTTNKAATSAVTAVASSATNTTVLASNTNRVFAAIYNAANKTMYVKLGTTASTSSYTIQIFSGSYWEVPNDYTGEIDAVWAASPSGNALVTELTP